MSIEVEATVRLQFGRSSREAETHTNLSAVREDGQCLWVAGDETATIERLVADDPDQPRAYGQERSFPLADFVRLPGDAEEEADVEGIGRAGPYLWVVGSHSRKRRKVKPAHADAKSIKRLAKIEDEANRRIIARIPVVPGSDGLPELARTATADGHEHTAASLGTGELLTEVLADDDHLGPFLAIPGKDNGLDVEGVAVQGDRVYLGLRGPVLRGWAVALEVEPRQDSDDEHRLGLTKIGPDKERFRKHFLDLDGLGIRDLCPDGPDLLVLAGPSMDLDGPVRLYRWHDAAATEAPEVVRGEEITRVADLPFGEDSDHAEGIALVTRAGRQRLLVVYDSPADDRLGEQGVVADVMRLPVQE